MSVITARRNKNKFILNQFLKHELTLIRKKVIYKNLNLSFSYRTKTFYHYLALVNKKFLTMLRLQCLVTHWNRSRYKFFGLNRVILRQYAHDAYLTGVTKASW